MPQEQPLLDAVLEFLFGTGDTFRVKTFIVACCLGVALVVAAVLLVLYGAFKAVHASERAFTWLPRRLARELHAVYARAVAPLHLLAAPGSRAELARSGPARAAIGAASALVRRPGDAAWFAVMTAACSVAAVSAASLAWRQPWVRQAWPHVRSGTSAMGAVAAVAAAAAESHNAMRDAAQSQFWFVAAVRGAAAATVGVMVPHVLRPGLVPSALQRRLPAFTLALLCVGAALQLRLLSSDAGWSPWALLFAAEELLLRGVLRLPALSAEVARGAKLLVADVRRMLSEPPPAWLLDGGRVAARAAPAAAASASSLAFASSALSANGACARVGFLAAAATQAAVAGVMAGGALQRHCVLRVRLHAFGTELEARAARAYACSDFGGFALGSAVARHGLLPMLRRIFNLGALLTRGMRPLWRAIRRPVAAVWHSPHASLAASLAVMAAAAWARKHSSALSRAAAAVAGAVRAVAPALRAVASARHAMPPVLEASASAAAWLHGGVTTLDAVLARGVHASPSFAVIVAAVHAAQAVVLRLNLDSDDAPATATALAAFFARSSGIALLLPLAAAHTGALLGLRPGGITARLARGAVPLLWFVLAAVVAEEGRQRCQLDALRAARAAAKESHPARVPEGDTCPICFDGMHCPTARNAVPVLALRCGHAFHTQCITAWLDHAAEEQKRCPICRRRAGDAGWRNVIFE